jgi:hypothetical protein
MAKKEMIELIETIDKLVEKLNERCDTMEANIENLYIITNDTLKENDKLKAELEKIKNFTRLPRSDMRYK